MGLRPYSSDSGPQANGPTQYPATNIAMVSVATSDPMWKCSMSSERIPSGADDANVLRDMISQHGRPVVKRKRRHTR